MCTGVCAIFSSIFCYCFAIFCFSGLVSRMASRDASRPETAAILRSGPCNSSDKPANLPICQFRSRFATSRLYLSSVSLSLSRSLRYAADSLRHLILRLLPGIRHCHTNNNLHSLSVSPSSAPAPAPSFNCCFNIHQHPYPF